MSFQTFEKFPLYWEKYKKDRQSISPMQPLVILERGKVPFAVFFILKGEAYAGNSSGRYLYFKFSEKSVVGETHLITGTPFSYTVFFEEFKGLNALVIPGNIFLTILKRYPLSYRILIE